MKRYVLIFSVLLPLFSFAQNLTWEEKISPKYSYTLSDATVTKKSDVEYQTKNRTKDYSLEALQHQKKELASKIKQIEASDTIGLEASHLKKYKYMLEYTNSMILKFEQTPKPKK